jgi:uncharacterized peroxidase-related enzyme
MFLTRTDPSDAGRELAEYFNEQRSRWGFLPNYAQCFATRPDVAAAWGTLNATIRDGMDRRRFELATVAAARALHSTYCTAAHSGFLRDVCHDEASLRSIADDPTGSSLEGIDRIVYQFAAQVATDASSITPDDIQTLRNEGLDDRDIADIVFAAAARSFFTRVLDGMGAQLDQETAAQFEPELLDSMVVGRPPAD